MNKKTKIITIAAVSGGGKTTVTENLTQKLTNSKALYFDSYHFKTVLLIFVNGLMREQIMMNGYLHH